MAATFLLVRRNVDGNMRVIDLYPEAHPRIGAPLRPGEFLVRCPSWLVDARIPPEGAPDGR